MEFAGEDWEEKINRVRENLVENKFFGMIVTELDEIAWLFNIRGEGRKSNKIIFSTVYFVGKSHKEGLYNSPTFESMSIVTSQEILLWVHPSKV